VEAAASSEVGAVAPPLVRRRSPVALLAIGIAALAGATHSQLSGAVVAAVIAIVLVVVAATDLERRIIPNVVVLPATMLVLVARITIAPSRWAEWLGAAVGAALAFLLPNLINRSAMGMGDVKLAAFLGAGLGWGVIGAVVLAFFSIFPVAVGTLIRGGLAAGKSTLPFGPFLAFGGLVILIVPGLLGLGGT
jgi:leader peptidase (prepilin peptidase)/N-methyltransferase